MAPIGIGTNVDSLKIQRLLGKATEAYSSTVQRLSSGLRINNPGDDAASLAVSSDLKFNSRVSAQAVQNVNDGISLLSIAETTLHSLLSISSRQLELATQAANGAYSLTQRKSADAEAEALRQEFNRLVNLASFNGRYLLDGSMISGIRIQAGLGTANSIDTSVGGQLARTTGNGTMGTATSLTMGAAFSGPRKVLTADFNGDGKADIITSNSGNGTVGVRLGNGDGTFGATTTTAIAGISDVAVGDFNNDGLTDIAATVYNGGLGNTVQVKYGTGTGGFAGTQILTVGTGPTPIITADFNGDGLTDLAVGEYGAGTSSILLNNGSGGFQARKIATTGTSIQLASGDFNGDGRADLVSVEGTNFVSILIGNGDGTFAARTQYATGTTSVSLAVSDLNYDGISDVVTGNYGGSTASVLIGNSNGTLQTASTINTGAIRNVLLQDIDGDGHVDLVNTNDGGNNIRVALGNGDGTFGSGSTYNTGTGPFDLAAADFNRDGAMDLVVGNFDYTNGNTVSLFLGNTRQLTTIGRLNLLTRPDAQTSMATIQQTQTRIRSELGVIGAAGSRFAHTMSAIEIARQNFDAADSRIVNADFAEEAASLVKFKVLQDAASAVLAQANQTPALVLKLLAEPE